MYFPSIGNRPHSTEKFSPLARYKYGVISQLVECKPELCLLKQVDESGNKLPICVKPETVPKLIERGWTDSILIQRLICGYYGLILKSIKDKSS